ncbi:baseplate assembly protein [Pseudoalteromonas sp. JBTF-M23]|uniref:Baseplate assembly protein n=1 Tax=Pseudoalteromonas caenipelagi TaxID=2726988 RepID=A0A849VC14_9GAMM|nr:baseplate J/gp47 family protein [Pseudoalteromonas caenipelagi]NOU49504.1 baseplate assembly protein [Pseudoalteromonas caenipelagi]
MTSYIDLSKLPDPNIIESLSFEAIYKARKARFIELAPDYAQALELESDPLTVWLQVESYQELLLRQRINQAAQSNLLAFAKGADLEHLGAFYGVERVTNEQDDDYRQRIRNNTIASSTAGSAEHYRNHAINAAPSEIADVSVISKEGGKVIVTVLAKQALDDTTLGETPQPQDAPPSKTTVERVKDKVLDDGVKMLTDSVTVQPADMKMVDIEADIYLQPNTSAEVFNELEQLLRDAWRNEAKLDWDLAPSWISAQLHKSGISQVEIKKPDGLINITPEQCAVPGDIKLTLCVR